MSRDPYVDPGTPLDVQGITTVSESIETLNKKMSGLNDVLKKATNNIKPLFDGLKKVLPKSMEGFTKLEPVANKIKSSKFQKGVKKLAGMYTKMLAAAGSDIMDKLSEFMNKISGLSTILTLLSPILGVISAIFAEAMVPVLQALMPLMKQLAMWLWENKETVMALIIVLMPLVLILQLLAAVVSGNWEAFNWFYNILDNLWTLIKDIGTWITDNFVKAWDWIYDGLKSVYDFINDKVLSVLDWFKDRLEDIVDVANTLTGQGGGGGGGGGGGSTPTIHDPLDLFPWFGPEVYKFDQPQLVGVGDEPGGEYLMGADKLGGLLSAAAGSGGGMQEEYLFELVNLTRNMLQGQQSQGGGYRRGRYG